MAPRKSLIHDEDKKLIVKRRPTTFDWCELNCVADVISRKAIRFDHKFKRPILAHHRTAFVLFFPINSSHLRTNRNLADLEFRFKTTCTFHVIASLILRYFSAPCVTNLNCLFSRCQLFVFFLINQLFCSTRIRRNWNDLSTCLFSDNNLLFLFHFKTMFHRNKNSFILVHNFLFYFSWLENPFIKLKLLFICLSSFVSYLKTLDCLVRCLHWDCCRRRLSNDFLLRFSMTTTAKQRLRVLVFSVSSLINRSS